MNDHRPIPPGATLTPIPLAGETSTTAPRDTVPVYAESED